MQKSRFALLGIVAAFCAAVSATPASAQIKLAVVDAAMMREVGLAWNLYYTTVGKAPAKAADLNDYLEGAKTKDALAQGAIVLIPNARAEAGSVVAHEKEPDKMGKRFVTFGDGSVKSLNEEEFKKLMGKK